MKFQDFKFVIELVKSFSNLISQLFLFSFSTTVSRPWSWSAWYSW